MKSFFDYLFYNSYYLAIRLGNEGFYPEVNAWFLATLLPWLNLFSALVLLKDHSILSKEVFNVLSFAISVLWVATAIYCLNNKDYKSLVAKENRAKAPESLGVFFILYLVFTIVSYLMIS